MSRKNILRLVIKMPFKLLKFLILILAAIGDAGANSTKTKITDYESGRHLYEIENNCIRDYQTGHRLYEVDDDYIKDYQTGHRLYEIDDNYIKDYQTGRRLYKIDGDINSFVIIIILINAGLLDKN